MRMVARAGESGPSGSGSEEKKPEFGYTRADIILIGGGLIALGYIMYYGLQVRAPSTGV